MSDGDGADGTEAAGVVERSLAQQAELALLLEVSGTPKPGNVDREREYGDLRFEHFLAGAVGARPGFERAADGERVGRAFERAVAGMAAQSGGNTQFGAALLVTPLVAAAARGPLTPERAGAVAESTSVADAADFYRAFEHVDVAVRDPPAEMDALDVRRGSDAVPTLRDRGLTLADVMERSADRDGVAAEWVGDFERVFAVAEQVAADEGPVTDRASRAFLDQLATHVDTFVVTRNDRETAREVRERAKAVLAGEEDADDLAREFVERDINPGTTADVVAGGLFVALVRGLRV